MVKIFVTDKLGQQHCVEARKGLSVMEALRGLNLGIAGECEGSLSCASCHVWIDQDWFDRLPPAGDAEADMLDCVFSATPTSRLCCQIMVDTELEGLRLGMAHA